MENKGYDCNSSILEDISYALLHNESIGDVTWYVDLTEGTVVSIQEEYTKVDRAFPFQEWEKECIRNTQKILEHELVEIDPEPKYVSFGIMEDFVEICPPEQQTVLLNALRKKHPFSNFRQSVDQTATILSASALHPLAFLQASTEPAVNIIIMDACRNIRVVRGGVEVSKLGSMASKIPYQTLLAFSTTSPETTASDGPAGGI